MYSLSGAGAETATTLFHRFKTRPFNISHGTVGGEKNALSWSNLSFQIKQGVSQGYSEKEIMVGVINAIDVKCPLKEFFEGSIDELSWEEFQDTLKQCVDADAKDSNTLMDEMVACKQGATESLMEYAIRMIDYRKKIVKVNQEEDCPLGEPVVRKRFVNSMLVGIRNATVRLELQPLLKDPNLTDKSLRTAIREIMTRNKASELKFESSTSKANVKSVKVVEEKVNKVDKDKEDKVLVEVAKIGARINEMNVSRDKEIAALQKQMDKFQQQLNLTTQNLNNNRDQNVERNDAEGNAGGEPGRNRNGGRGRQRFIKCDACETTGAFCTHCWKCGSGDHKKHECPLNE